MLATELDKVTDEDWQRIMAVNVIGPFHCARAVKEPMLAAGGGQIINVTSVAAFAGKGSSIPYAASKAALNNLTIALARTLAPHIRVNAVAPGFITGRWLEQGFGEAYEGVKRTVEKVVPVGKGLRSRGRRRGHHEPGDRLGDGHRPGAGLRRRDVDRQVSAGMPASGISESTVVCGFDQRVPCLRVARMLFRDSGSSCSRSVSMAPEKIL